MGAAARQALLRSLPPPSRLAQMVWVPRGVYRLGGGGGAAAFLRRGLFLDAAPVTVGQALRALDAARRGAQRSGGMGRQAPRARWWSPFSGFSRAGGAAAGGGPLAGEGALSANAAAQVRRLACLVSSSWQSLDFQGGCSVRPNTFRLINSQHRHRVET